jgi:hypothetical protein
MEREQATLNAFVQVHGHKATKSSKYERIVHLAHNSEQGISIDATLTQYTIDDLVDHKLLNADSQLVRWLYRQIKTYDVDKEHVIGLIFDENTVLAHVIQKKA